MLIFQIFVLRFITSKSFFENNKDLCKDFKKGTEEAIKIIINDLDYALHVYYSETKQEKTAYECDY